MSQPDTWYDNLPPDQQRRYDQFVEILVYAAEKRPLDQQTQAPA